MVPKHSRDVKWITDGRERFGFLIGKWDVSAAKRILREKPRKVVLLELDEEVKKWVKLSPEDGELDGEGGLRCIAVKMRVDEEVLVDADLELPLILITIGKGEEKTVLPIDGWHRITKAIRAGLTKLPAVVLNQKESRVVRYV